MSVVLYNTLTRQKEPLETLEPGRVKIYCCGVTVYNYSHLGHARSSIVWDTVRRYLLWRGYDVRYVQNFTDIDDKILNRAKEENSSMQTVAERYTQAYLEDIARLNVMEADEYTYATKTLDGIQRLIGELEQKGYAYPAGGDVYYAVRKFDGYGKLSGRKLDDMQAGASGRVAEEEAVKQDPFDFALWKGAKEGEPFWESPWGPGRPGWHIECSAMIREVFDTPQGDERPVATIDIHVGGSDLVFPHHENEIAQSEAATGHPLSRYWMHNGMVNVGGEKMSKSLGNFTTIRNLLDAPNAPDPMAIRLFLLQAHYRKPVDFTEEALASAQNAWKRLSEALLFGSTVGKKLGWDLWRQTTEFVYEQDESSIISKFEEAMDDDFNTPVAISVLFELVSLLQKERNRFFHSQVSQEYSSRLQRIWRTLVVLSRVLGLEIRRHRNGVALTGEELQRVVAEFSNYPFWEVAHICGYPGLEASVKPIRNSRSSENLEFNSGRQRSKQKKTYFRKNFGEFFAALGIEDRKVPEHRLEGLQLLDTIQTFWYLPVSEKALLCGYSSGLLRKSKLGLLSQVSADLIAFYEAILSANRIQSPNPCYMEISQYDDSSGLSDKEIEALLTQRREARAAKNFAEGDRIRDLLQDAGITLIDKPDGVTEWHR